MVYLIKFVSFVVNRISKKISFRTFINSASYSDRGWVIYCPSLSINSGAEALQKISSGMSEVVAYNFGFYNLTYIKVLLNENFIFYRTLE